MKEKHMRICPFCYGEGDVRRTDDVKAPDGGGGYLPYCTCCGVHPAYAFFTLQDAINWWNREPIIDKE